MKQIGRVPWSEVLVVVRLSAAAASTLEELKTQGRAGLEHAISQRKVCVRACGGGLVPACEKRNNRDFNSVVLYQE